MLKPPPASLQSLPAMQAAKYTPTLLHAQINPTPSCACHTDSLTAYTTWIPWPPATYAAWKPPPPSTALQCPQRQGQAVEVEGR